MSWPLLKEKWSSLQEKKTKSGGWVRLYWISGYSQCINTHLKANHFYNNFYELGLFQIGHIEGQPDRKGVFPMSFVQILSDWYCDWQVWGCLCSTSFAPLASHQTPHLCIAAVTQTNLTKSKRKKYHIKSRLSETWRVNWLKCVLTNCVILPTSITVAMAAQHANLGMQ